MIELYAKIVNNQITEVSSGKGTSGTWIEVKGYQGEDQTLTYDVSTNTVKVEDKIDEKPVATIEELDAVQLEIDKEELRNHRNILLMESDWTQNRDVVLSNDEEWKTYRQALRDITKTYKNQMEVVWPTPPS